MFVDLPEDQLREYRSSVHDPADFDEFWARTIAAARAYPLDLELNPVDTGLREVDVFDLTFTGSDATRVHAWLRLPRQRAAALPAVVHFNGYGAGRGHPLDDIVLAASGYASLLMDTRGQGSGVTEDIPGVGPASKGLLTRGIASRETYYYRRVFADAVRAVDAVRSLDSVDPAWVSVAGNSQGGGIALAVSGLVDDLVAGFFQAPFLCDFPRASVATDAYPYRELGDALAQRHHDRDLIFETLSYFDGVNFARRAVAPGWFSIGLMDGISLPSSVFAAHNAYRGEKSIRIWPFNGHEAGGSDDLAGLISTLHRLHRTHRQHREPILSGAAMSRAAADVPPQKERQ
ncbi:acetylxylan esterase [Lacisediminihabitans changchengi]|uniref:Acetylxylan esterase n=1 Tax=Lacisediminihabitans changchengi TaxID=2787634 RepID=A0A934W1Y5_9MICO|nr:acetylxylan esterase [Lacisediminihabitans changchengi]MBK4346276.1 acetylxylan esterase [Lacisediminihabitans changchengi]